MDKSKIDDLYQNTQLTVQQIADRLGTTWKIVGTYVNKKYDEEYRKIRKSQSYRNSKLGMANPMTGKFKDQHPRFKEVVGDCKGYLMVLKPDWYTGRKGSKHVFLHTVVMCEALGLTEFPANFVIHHIDGNPHNNDIKNLSLMTNSGHSSLHQILKKNVQRLSQLGVGDENLRSAQPPISESEDDIV